MKHDFYTNEDGETDIWYMDYDIHNGPGCRACVMTWCMHCQEDFWEEECPDRQEALFEIENGNAAIIIERF